MITIRHATPADAAMIAENNARLAWESENKTLDPAMALLGVRAAIADPEKKGPYYLACDGDEVIGQCQVTFEWSDWRNGWFWWIQSVYVRENNRGAGIFRKLYEHVRQDALAVGNVLALRLYVERENRNAQAVYSRLGMELEHYDIMRETLLES
jgi:GNAT superfamily N-acetyltransferase